MMSSERLVVIGGGQAATQLIEVARQKGFAGPITLITEEAVLPYQRPPLSKQYLTDGHDRQWLLYRPERFYQRHRIDVRLGRRAMVIDRDHSRVSLDDSTFLEYDKLAIVTGARSRRLGVPGSDHPRVCYVRDILDAERLRAVLPRTRRVVVIGGGFIGLEAAAVLTQAGIEVTLMASGNRLIPRLCAPEVSAELADLHSRRGANLVMSADVREMRHGADETEVVLANGSKYRADIVIAGVGAIPNVELAQSCGLVCSDGIEVDEEARTSDPRIFAAGDCTNHPNALLGRRLRLETVHNAVEQGRTAGAAIAGVNLPYNQTPWVWSDQYHIRLQCAGVADGYDQAVLRGEPLTGRFSYIYFRDGRLQAVTCFNQPMVFGAIRRLLNEQIPLTPDEAADPAFDLAALPAKRARLEFDVPWPSKFDQQATVQWGHV